MYIRNSIYPIVKIYPSLFFKVSKGFIPNFADNINQKYIDFKKTDKKYFNFSYNHIPIYNPAFSSHVQLSICDLKSDKSNISYQTICEIRDKSSNNYIYEIIKINSKNNSSYSFEAELMINQGKKIYSKIEDIQLENIILQAKNFNQFSIGILQNTSNKSLKKILYQVVIDQWSDTHCV